MSSEKEVSIAEFVASAKRLVAYLVTKWIYFLLIGIIAAVAGFIYASYQDPVYTAEMTFAPESENASAMGYMGLAAQLGFDLPGSGGNTFAGENLSQLMKSRKLIEMTLLRSVNIDGVDQLLVNYYLKVNEIDKQIQKDKKYKGVVFTPSGEPHSRIKDSLFKSISENISKSIDITKIDKMSDFISVTYKDSDEKFAKNFVEQLVGNVIDFYTNYKVGKTKRNVEILQRQTDSVRRLISGNIEAIAVSNDLNINPARQVARTGVQRRQVDAQVNGALYTELVKNLEMSKLSLRKETPLIQVIDPPMYPLEKKKLGRFKAAVIFSFVAFLLTLVVFVTKRVFRNIKENAAVTSTEHIIV